MPRLFTLDEARKELPRVTRALREALHSKAEYERAEQAIQTLVQRITFMGGLLVDSQEAEGNKTAREDSGQRLKAAFEEIEEIGCLVKDLAIGLIDFPTLFRKEEVYLCWRMGEDDICFWHGVHEGFGGRKPIDQAFIDQHRGGETN